MTSTPEHNLYAWYDSSATPQRVYTLSPTLSVGMELYDNTGTSISKTVGTINQDGSFDAESSGTTYYAWTKNNDSYYTLSSSPQEGDNIYTYMNNQFLYFDIIPWVDGNTICVPDEGVYTRDSSKDVTI